MSTHKTAAQPSFTDRDRTLDTAITRVLTRPPEPSVPVDFAARVTRQIAAEPAPHTSMWAGWGPRLALASGALLTLALFALAPHAVPNLANLSFDAELVLFTELGTLLLFTPKFLQRD